MANRPASKSPAQETAELNSCVGNVQNSSHVKEVARYVEFSEVTDGDSEERDLHLMLGAASRLTEAQRYVYPRATEIQGIMCQSVNRLRNRGEFFRQFTLKEKSIHRIYKDSKSYCFDITLSGCVVTASNLLGCEKIVFTHEEFSDVFQFPTKSRFTNYRNISNINPMVSTLFDLTQVRYKTVDTIIKRYQNSRTDANRECAHGSSSVPETDGSTERVPLYMRQPLHHPQSDIDQRSRNFGNVDRPSVSSPVLPLGLTSRFENHCSLEDNNISLDQRTQYMDDLYQSGQSNFNYSNTGQINVPNIETFNSAMGDSIYPDEVRQLNYPIQPYIYPIVIQPLYVEVPEYIPVYLPPRPIHMPRGFNRSCSRKTNMRRN